MELAIEIFYKQPVKLDPLLINQTQLMLERGFRSHVSFFQEISEKRRSIWNDPLNPFYITSWIKGSEIRSSVELPNSWQFKYSGNAIVDAMRLLRNFKLELKSKSIIKSNQSLWKLASCVSYWLSLLWQPFYHLFFSFLVCFARLFYFEAIKLDQ